VEEMLEEEVKGKGNLDVFQRMQWGKN